MNIDRFRVRQFIGRGPLTAVYAAEDTVTGSLFALKTLPGVISEDRDAATRFRKALLGPAHFVHPHFVKLRHLHEIWEIDDRGTAAMGVSAGSQVLLSDLVQGGSLIKWTAQFPRSVVPKEKAIEVLRTVAAALDDAHAAGLFHGYLSPSNILFPGTEPLITDLGVARLIREALDEKSASPDLKAGPVYASPECRQFGLVNPASDQYALAALYCDMVEGMISEQQQVHARSGEKAVARALAEAPVDRFGSCMEFIRALEDEVLTGPFQPPTRAALSPLNIPVAHPSTDHPAATVSEEEIDLHLQTLAGQSKAEPAVTPLRKLRNEPGSSSEAKPVEHAEPGPRSSPSEPEPTPLRQIAEGAGSADMNRPAEPQADARPSSSPPSLPPAWSPVADTPRRKRPLVSSLNTVIAVGALILFVLLGISLWTKHGQSANKNAPVLEWSQVSTRTNLPRDFVETVRLKEGLGRRQHLQGRLAGQTCIMELRIAGGMAQITRRTSADTLSVLSEKPLTKDLGPDTTVQFTKSPSGVAVYAEGLRVVSAPCPVEEWGEFVVEIGGDPLPEVHVSQQKIGALVFADDFMHGENELGVWEPISDNWTVHALQNPIRSANPFSFLGRGKDAVALAGAWFWRNYSFDCSIHPLEGSAFGLKFCRIDTENTYELIWGKETDGTHSILLLKVHDGERKVLKKAEMKVHTAQWLRLNVSQFDGLITVQMDGRPIMEAVDDSPLFGGRIALWSRGGEGTVFDDVKVTQVGTFDLRPGGELNYPSTVLAVSKEETSGNVLRHYAIPAALLQNVSLAVRTGSPAGYTAPLELAVRQSGSESVRLRLNPATGGRLEASILTFDGEFEHIHASTELAVPSTETQFNFHVHGRQAWAEINGSLVLYADKIELTRQGTCEAVVPESLPVLSLNVTRKEALTPIANRVETFTHEESMQNWNSPVLEWSPDYTNRLGGYWHTSDFWNDVSVTMDVDTMLQLKDNVPVGVMLKWPDGGTEEKGPIVSLMVLPEEGVLEVTLPGAETHRHTLVKAARTIELEKRCDRLLLRMNGDLLWNEPLPAGHGPLCRVGRIGRGASDTWAEAVSICAAGVKTYSFKDAPTDWLPAAGDWQVTNRWQCDPRWSFYSGVQRHGVACNWNKLEHGQNVSIEFFAGPKMDQERGRKYEYAADINAVICADGRDISSGYSFLFGGWNDRGSQIVRGTGILKENRQVVIPRAGSTHRRWFHLKLRKFGNRLSFWVDGAQVASVEDQSPLTGNRFALWTWDNGMMVAQLRLATEGLPQTADTAQAPLTVPQTPYDKK